MEFKIKAKLITSDDLRRIIIRLAHEIVEKNRGTTDLVIIGLHTRGAHLAERISKKIAEIEGVDVPTGYLDVTFYRDDFRTRLKQPEVQQPGRYRDSRYRRYWNVAWTVQRGEHSARQQERRRG